MLVDVIGRMGDAASVSNFYREWFEPGPYNGKIWVGAEDVDGTGQVEIGMEDVHCDGTVLFMPWPAAVELAEFILAKAREAAAAEAENAPETRSTPA